MLSARSTTSRRASLRIGGATVALVVLSGLAPFSATAAEGPIAAPDGSSAASAAASCWEIKQNTPAAPDGTYWLYTPALGAPEQFYCDQTTDGGGWVLIGRGRENWSQSGEGFGTTADVRSVITGTQAFAPRQLGADVINGLLNNTAVSSLPDGVRLRRATNTEGTTWQEARFTYATPRDDWSWLMNSQQTVGTWSFDGVTGTGGGLTSFGDSQQTFNRVQTETSAANGWSNGFGYGTELEIGDTSASSYIYDTGPATWGTNWRGQSVRVTNPYARPFTQVYLRPQLTSSDILTAIPDEGTPAVAQRSIAESFALPTVYGVSGLGAAGAGIQNTEVSDFAEADGRVYVAGNFANVQTSSAGANKVGQSYLAAFDVTTAEYIPAFRPTFNNQVKTIVSLGSNRLAVGGQFSQANGQPANGLVVIDATTGATDTGWTGRLVNNLSSSGGQAIVRSLDVQGDWLYAGGSFTHATGGGSAGQVYSRAGVRFSIANGTPDSSWTPEFDGTVISLDASAQGDRVYFAGYFANNRGQAALRVAAVSTVDAAAMTPWVVDFSADQELGRDGYQQAVLEVGDRVWLGGAEHMLFSFDRSSLAELSTNITIQGGDFQTITADGDNVYAGCHCSLANYTGADKWPSLGTWTRASKIEQLSAWSNTDGSFRAEYSPSFSTREGAGGWASLVDSTGVLWVGGDFTGVRRSATASQWAGGFARFARTDSTAPATPTGFTAANTATGVDLSWAGVSDAAAYQVLRNDRVVATVTGTSVTLPDAPVGTKYFVRAVDAAGNFSASTAAITAAAVSNPDQPAGSVLIANGATWQYLYPTDTPVSAWRTPSFDDSSWSSGTAPIGWGTPDIATQLPNPTPRPLTAYYRKTFILDNAATLASVTLTTRADDGIVVYVNGTEAGRSNMPAGATTATTYATTARNATTALGDPVTFTVPGSLFTNGTNVITAEVHSNYKATPSASFELTAEATYGATPGGGGTEPGALPVGTVVKSAGSAWSYYREVAAPGDTWRTAGFDSSSWPTGDGPLGWGSAGIVTEIPQPDGQRPLATYFRSSFTLPDGQIPAGGLTLTTRADDGILVFVNGTEVGRSNVPAGEATHDSYAVTPVSSTSAANPVTFTVPASVLVEGSNVITAQVQSNWRATTSVSFDLEAKVAAEGEQPADGGAEPAPGGGGAAPAGEVIAAGAAWTYYHQADAPDPAWKDASFDASGWASGNAPLGWGSNTLATEIPSPGSSRPLATYYRSTFEIPAGQVPANGLTLTTRADDGIIVYVNGVEAGRSNLPTGDITHTSYATTARSTATAVANPVTFTVPASALTEGTNLITVQVQSNYRATLNSSFDLTATIN